MSERLTQKPIDYADHAADATAAAVLCGQATRQYLDQTFKPQIPENANLKADELDRLLAPFLRPPPSKQTLIENAMDFQDPDSRSPSVEGTFSM